MVFEEVLFFIASLAAIILGAELLISSSTKIAKHFGTSDFLIGLTLIAIGTSIPELSIAVAASLKKESIISLGNLVGASITNITLTLGIALLAYALKIETFLFKKESLILLLTTSLFLAFALDKNISGVEGAILLGVFIYYLYNLSRNQSFNVMLLPQKNYSMIKDRINIPRQVLFTLIGVTLIYFGAKYLIPSTISLASLLKIPSVIISLTVISIGTTLPEITVTVIAARKGLTGLYLGNLIGSNIVNLLMIAGIASIIEPIALGNILLYDIFPFLLLSTITFFIFFRNSFSKRVLQGLTLIAIYIAYIITLTFIR